MTDSRASRPEAEHRRFAVQAALLAVAVFLGVAGGIYVGTAGARARTVAPEALRNTSNLEIGDPFPDHEVWVRRSNAKDVISHLAQDGPLLVFFVSQHCEACLSLYKHWNRRVVPQLDPSIRMVAIYDDAEQEAVGSSAASGSLAGADVCFADRESQREVDGIVATPTVVGIGTDRQIRFIMTGFDRNVDSKFINEVM